MTVCHYNYEHLYDLDRYSRFDIAEYNEPEISYETFRDPVLLENGIHLPRIYECRKNREDETVLHTITLDVSQSAFGDNALVEIRPVDMSKPAVEW